eukprot:21762-Eustigmatos_ZCMA.PRE.1
MELDAVMFLHVMLAFENVKTFEFNAVKLEVHVTELHTRSMRLRVVMVAEVTVADAHVTEAMLAVVTLLFVILAVKLLTGLEMFEVNEGLKFATTFVDGEK